MFMGLAHRGTLNFLPLYFGEAFRGILKPVVVGGFLTALVLASGILGQFLGGIWGERYPRSRILIIIVALNIPFLIMMSTMKGYTVILIAMLWGIVNFSYQPISNALISDFSKPSQRGTLFGFLHGLNFGVGALAATLAGAIGDRFGTAAIFTAMGILLVPAIFASYLLRRTYGSLSIDSE
jgi:MFS family permease